jgi:hypothetical protein
MSSASRHRLFDGLRWVVFLPIAIVSGLGAYAVYVYLVSLLIMAESRTS